MYKKIAAIESREDETEIHDELIDRYGEMPKAVVNIINVALIKIPAREVGCVEITEKMRVLTLKFSEGRLTPGIVFGLDNEFRGRVKVLSDQTPSIQIRMLEKDKGVLEFVNKILILIKELQN